MREAADQVAPAELDAVEPEGASGVVDEAFKQVRRVRPSRTSIGPRRNLVRALAEHGHRRRRNVVAAGEEHAGGMGRDRGAGEQVRAEVSGQRGPQREHVTLGVQRQLHRALDPPTLIGRKQVLRPILDPLHRTSQVDRCDRRDDGLDRDHALAAEGAANIGHDHAEALLVPAKDVSELGPRAVRVLHRAPHGEPLALGVVLDDGPAGFDRRSHHPGQRVAPVDDTLGSGKRTRNVPARVRPAREHDVRGPGVEQRFARLVVDFDQLR